MSIPILFEETLTISTKLVKSFQDWATSINDVSFSKHGGRGKKQVMMASHSGAGIEKADEKKQQIEPNLE